MQEFDDLLPQREFDNFQFVDFASAVTNVRNPQASFALASLMEIPDQFFAIRKLKILDRVWLNSAFSEAWIIIIVR